MLCCCISKMSLCVLPRKSENFECGKRGGRQTVREGERRRESAAGALPLKNYLWAGFRKETPLLSAFLSSLVWYKKRYPNHRRSPQNVLPKWKSLTIRCCLVVPPPLVPPSTCSSLEGDIEPLFLSAVVSFHVRYLW